VCSQASLAVTVDPVDRAMRVRAGVVFPGPEWREDVYNEDTKRIELVQVRGHMCSSSRFLGQVLGQVFSADLCAQVRSLRCACCAL
jgi:hypothetical protein